MAESGIYEIVNLVNGKRYVGSALNFRARWAKHRCELGKQRHHSKHLQNAWNKYGEGKFEFRILERCGRDLLLEREQFHIDKGCDYNKCMVAGSPLGVKHSTESRRKMSASRKGKKKTAAAIAASSAGLRRRFREPGVLEAHRRMVKESYTEELRLVRSKQSQERWANPEYRDSMSKKIAETHDAQRRALTSQQAKQRWSDPAYRSRMADAMANRPPVSDETRQKLREAQLGKSLPLHVKRQKAALSDVQAEEILKLRLTGWKYSDLAEEYGVSALLVARLCRGERYRWVAPHVPRLVDVTRRRNT